MIQLAMLFVLGALGSGLVALGILPLLVRGAERRAKATLERQLPLTLPEIAAERDQLRAAHAVEVRQLEQRMDIVKERVATLLTDNGRQGTRLAMLEQRGADADAAMAALRAERDAVEHALRASEATLGSQAVVLHDAYVASERRRDLLDVATVQLAAAESLAADQRTVIADLERHLAGRAGPATGATRPPPRSGDDMIQLRAAYGRLRDEHDIMRKGYDAMSSEREKLRFRIDELLLQIEELREQAEEDDGAVQDLRRRAAGQEKTIATLTARVAAREEALGTVKRLLAEETSRRKTIEADRTRPRIGAPEEAPRNDAAALRLAISALAADLVRVAGEEAAADEPAVPSSGRR